MSWIIRLSIMKYNHMLYLTWEADLGCATQGQPLPPLFPWSWRCTFRGDCPPHINPVTSLTFHSAKITCVWNTVGRGEEGGGCLTVLHKIALRANALVIIFFPSCSSHVLCCKLHHLLWSQVQRALAATSMETPHVTSHTANVNFLCIAMCEI